MGKLAAPDRRRAWPNALARLSKVMDDFTFCLADEAATKALGRALAPLLANGDAVALNGPLGAGKTTLARAIITTATGAQEAASPTFSLVETYSGPAYDIWHYDLYRLDAPEDVWEAGLEEALENVVLIEWSERIERYLPEDLLILSLAHEGGTSQRRVTVRTRGGWVKRIKALDVGVIATA